MGQVQGGAGRKCATTKHVDLFVLILKQYHWPLNLNADWFKIEGLETAASCLSLQRGNGNNSVILHPIIAISFQNLA